MESINLKLVYLNNLKYDYLIDCENANENLDYLDITPQCEIEIERLKKLLNFENNQHLPSKNKFENTQNAKVNNCYIFSLDKHFRLLKQVVNIELY